MKSRATTPSPDPSPDAPRVAELAVAPASSGPRIHRLETRLINQIAAGEVVGRPAAAIKELIENAIDAGAGRIEVHVEGDALNFMVRDDGCGMGEDDLRLSVERYATSKIRELEDLERIATRGFRGEALAAIAAVARVEIVSRAREATAGHRLSIRGGRDLRVEPIGAPTGTAITVRDLFFNTPARLKFLKNPVAEWGHILQAVVRQALTRPDIAFSIRWKERPYLDLPAGQSLARRLAEVLPGGAAEGMLEVAGELQGVTVRGAVTHPHQSRRDRRHQYFFVNGRPIQFRPLQFAMEEAYRGLLMVQRFPMGALLIELPGEMVDVNVHPTKEEVRFRQEGLITGAAHRAVAEALRAADLVPTLNVPPPGSGMKFQPAGPMAGGVSRPIAPPQPPGVPPLAMDQPRAAEGNGSERTDQPDFVPGFGLKGGDTARDSVPPPPSRPAAEEYADPAAQEEATLIGRLRAMGEPPRVLAQIAATYILADAGPEGLLVIDQHAAHEKILYVQFLRECERREGVVVQPLLLPHAIDLAPADAAALEAVAPELARLGFEVEPFGGNTFVVQALPAAFERLNVEAFIRDLIDDIGQGDLTREMQRLRHKIVARAACRAAVKSGDILSAPEMQRLVADLLGTEESLRCPHGRPTTLRLTRDQLDQQFGRLG
jgi:DNA mismatch repair protein MutL